MNWCRCRTQDHQLPRLPGELHVGEHKYRPRGAPQQPEQVRAGGRLQRTANAAGRGQLVERDSRFDNYEGTGVICDVNVSGVVVMYGTGGGGHNCVEGLKRAEEGIRRVCARYPIRD